MAISESPVMRDYSLVGKESKLAVEMGLAEATWYSPPVPREKLKELLVRRNGPAIRDTILWFSLIIGSGYLVYFFWGTWWFIPPFIMYSALYASTSDSRWHESLHGTVFKTDWMNNILYEIASFMILRQSTVWRWSHTRHHSDTIIRGRDAEIAVPRPPNIGGFILKFFGIKSAIAEFKKMFIHASGRIHPEVASYLPVSEYKKVFWKARLYLLIYATVIGLSIYHFSILPLMFIGLPTLFGTWLMAFYGLTQHAGLAENVLDHRLNTRTIYMNRVNRYLYWHMGYHLEHHLFPLVPCYNLSKLHELIKDDCPKPYNGLIEAYREIIPAILRQSKDTSYYVHRPVPTPSGVSHKTAIKTLIPEKEKQDSEGNIFVCGEDELKIQDVARFDIDKRTFAVYRVSEKEFYATDGHCTHGNAHLASGLLIGNLIECSKHNGRFNVVDGSVQRPPVNIPVKTYPVVNRNGKIMVNINPKSSVNEIDATQEFSFRVISNNNVATFIKELVLEEEGDKKLEYEPGQYIHLEIPEYDKSFSNFIIDPPYNKTWKEMDLFRFRVNNRLIVRRNYSMGSDPQSEKQIRFNVRIEFPPAGLDCNAGVGSSYVFGLEPGDMVKANGPYGDFLIKNTQKEMVYLGGGAGMAPLRSHLAHLFQTQKTRRKVSFWYGARSLQELFYREYFEKLQDAFENFSFHVALSEPLEQDKWQSHTGFIHEILKKEYLDTCNHISEIEFYLCGPPGLIQAATTMLKGFGVEPGQISFDEFG